jgi:hypothetical protein
MRSILFFGLLVLGLVYTTFATGCSAVSKGAKHAAGAVIDCTVDELANVKPVASAMVPELLEGELEWKDVETVAIGAGTSVGGCLLRHLHDLIPKPPGFVGIPSQAELALSNFREATGTTAKYRTASGAL